MENIKFNIVASQAKSIYLYKNTRSKLQNCCANIYFNRQCLIKKVTPKYANIKFPNTSPSSQITTKKVQITRIKDEIKFLHKKKDKLNLDLYNIHLKATKKWGRVWDIILPSVIHTLNLGMEKRYKQLDLKINKLVATHTEKPKIKTQFYPKVINKTDITFTDEEMTLLNKGLKYNLNYRNKGRLSTLALEAETAISLLPSHEQEYLRYQVAHNLQKLYKQQDSIHTAKDFRNENKTVIKIRKKAKYK
jgi:hypothetical protein